MFIYLAIAVAYLHDTNQDFHQDKLNRVLLVLYIENLLLVIDHAYSFLLVLLARIVRVSSRLEYVKKIIIIHLLVNGTVDLIFEISFKHILHAEVDLLSLMETLSGFAEEFLRIMRKSLINVAAL